MNVTNSIILNLSSGDEYRIMLVDAPTEYLSEGIRNLIYENSVDIKEIIIERIHGGHVTNQRVLHQISNWLAECFIENPNMVLFYQCDDMNPIPSRNENSSHKRMPVQEYRSRLFSRLFNTYVSSHHIHDVINYPIRIDGEGYSYFMHIIARLQHTKVVECIGADVLEGFGK